jgi:hypothetical protein
LSRRSAPLADPVWTVPTPLGRQPRAFSRVNEALLQAIAPQQAVRIGMIAAIARRLYRHFFKVLVGNPK